MNLAVAAALPACGASRRDPTETPRITTEVSNLDAFEAAYNQLVLMDPEDRGREDHLRALFAFLLEYLDERLAESDDDEAVTALRYSISLYTPAELRTRPEFVALAERARAVYRRVAKRGDEQPAMLALAIEQRFGDEPARSRALEDWKLLEGWMIENDPFAADPLRRFEQLGGALEQVASVFPSPFVTGRLADLYVARYEVARQARKRGHGDDPTLRWRMESTGYHLLRAYLRADDLEGAIASTERVPSTLETERQRRDVAEALKSRRSALPLLSLAEQFTPDGGSDSNPTFTTQGWGIVDNLSRRAVHDFPNDPYAHLTRARALHTAGLIQAATVHLRQTLELKEDLFEAWQLLAEVEQGVLLRLAEDDPLAAEAHLRALERLHARAIELWADRPIQPGLPQAFYTVAEGLYQAGEVARAESLLERSLGIEPVPNSIDLLGTIALKRSNLSQARERYENLANLAYESEVTRLQWEARARFQLGEIAARQGDAAGSSAHIRMALRHTNDLLARSGTAANSRANRYIERGKLLFLLGEVDLAMDDFGRASELAPANVKTYADPLRYVVEYGYHAQARSIFRRAMAQNGISSSLKLYFSLWMKQLAVCQGLPPDAEAQRFLVSYSGHSWGQLLAQHALGELSFETLIARAQNRGERAEAFFYEGLKRWGSGDLEGGKSMMQKVLSTEMMGFLEYDMALSYLEWGDVPSQARSPVSAQLSSQAEPRSATGETTELSPF